MRRTIYSLIGILVGVTLLSAVPAAFAAEPASSLFRTQQSDIDATSTDAPPSVAAALRLPDTRHVAKLRCLGSVADTGRGSVECVWAVRPDVAVAGWQLWNIQLRPEHGQRKLVAELGAETLAHVDFEVLVPATYLYVVLGLDADGAIIAKSAPVSVMLVSASHDEVLRLHCRATIGDDRPDSARVIGCGRSESSVESAIGYVLWRSVDGGDRSVVGRTGLDTNTFIDTEVSVGHRYTYVVTAVDKSGEVVGRSRAVHVHLPNTGPHDRRLTDVRPADRPRSPDRPDAGSGR